MALNHGIGQKRRSESKDECDHKRKEGTHGRGKAWKAWEGTIGMDVEASEWPEAKFANTATRAQRAVLIIDPYEARSVATCTLLCLSLR